MTYDRAAWLVQTWGLVFFVLLFCLVLAYVFWPSNRQRFTKAARAPLDESAVPGVGFMPSVKDTARDQA